MALDYTNLYPSFAPSGDAVKEWSYTTTDNLATVMAAGYFNAMSRALGIGDVINVSVVDSILASSRTTVDDAVELVVASNVGGVVVVETTRDSIVGGLGDVIELVGDGAPDSSVQASKSINPTGDDNALLFTAVAYGEAGNDITVAYVDPGADDADIEVAVVGSAITVSLATDSEGAITSTAADVLAAIQASEAADALATVEVDTSDSGTEDDGSGVVTAVTATALEGGTGVGVGTAGTGSRYTNITDGELYLNTGPKDAPVWEMLAFVS